MLTGKVSISALFLVSHSAVVNLLPVLCAVCGGVWVCHLLCGVDQAEISGGQFISLANC